MGMHEHNVPPIFRHPGAVYINKRFASFGWSSSRITYGACCYILYGPNRSPLTDRSAGATVQGNSTIYELSTYGCLATAYRRLCLPIPRTLDSLILPEVSPRLSRIEERRPKTIHRWGTSSYQSIDIHSAN